MPERRGVIINEGRASQIRDFSKLLIGKITPTDLDMLIEYHDKCFVFCETKYDGAPLPFGQSLALERLCDVCESAGKVSILFITTHNTQIDEVIDMGMTVVTAYRFKFKWQPVEKTVLLKDAVRSFIEKQERYGGYFTRDESISEQLPLALNGE
jgi:hypothetical protein